MFLVQSNLLPHRLDQRRDLLWETRVCAQSSWRYRADSRHVFATAVNAATFFCAHVECVRHEKSTLLKLSVVDSEQTTQLLDETLTTSQMCKIAALNNPTQEIKFSFDISTT